MRKHAAMGRGRRSAAWLGAWLVVFAALFPLVSQAGSRVFGTVDWVELCTTYGMERIALDRDGNPVEPDDEVRSACTVCTVAATSLVLPATPPHMPLYTSIVDLVLCCPVYVQPDMAEYFHIETRPRAPPVIAG